MDGISMLLYAEPDAPTRRISLLSSGEWQQRGSSRSGKRRHLATAARTYQRRMKLTNACSWHYTVTGGICCSDFARRRTGVRVPLGPLSFPSICRLNAMIERRRRHALRLWCSNAARTEARTRSYTGHNHRPISSCLPWARGSNALGSTGRNLPINQRSA